MKINLTIMIAGPIMISSILGVVVAIFILNNSMKRHINIEKKQISQLVRDRVYRQTSDVLEGIDLTIDNFIRDKQLHAALISDNKLYATKKILEINAHELEVFTVSLYLNRGNTTMWVDAHQFVSLKKHLDLSQQIEEKTADIHYRLVTFNVDAKKMPLLLVSSYITDNENFVKLGELRAAFDIGSHSAFSQQLLLESGALCLVVAHDDKKIFSATGDQACIDRLYADIDAVNRLLPGNSMSLGSYFLVKQAFKEDISLEGLYIVTAQLMSGESAQYRYIQVMLAISLVVFMSAFLSLFFIRGILRRLVKNLSSFVGQDINDTFRSFEKTQIREFQDIANSYQKVREDLDNEVLERERVEGDIKKLNLKLESADAEKMKDLGALTAGVAHDFNNILMIIKSNLEVVELMNNDKEIVEESLTIISEATVRASALVGDLLLYVHNQHKACSPSSLREVIHKVTKMLPSLINNNINRVVNIEGDSSYTVEMNSEMCISVLLNLVSNAKDSMPEGGELTLNLSQLKRNNKDYCLLSVIDTGVGISDKNLKVIFEPFFTTKGVGKGTGLGLLIVNEFVKQCKGEIKVVSKLTIGTEVQLYLPLVATLNIIEEPVAEIDVALQSKQILVVDDELSISISIKHLLNYHGADVTTVDKVSTAKQILMDNKSHFDFIITDMQFPKGAGMELIQFIEERLPELKILIISGYFENVSQAHQYAFLQKPFSSYDLLQAIHSLLDS